MNYHFIIVGTVALQMFKGPLFTYHCMVTEQTGEAYSIIKCKLKQVATVNNRLEEQLQN